MDDLRDDTPTQATPATELRAQIMNPNVPKNEREWWASHEIDRLTKRVEELETQAITAEENDKISRDFLAVEEKRHSDIKARLAEIESLSLSGMETTAEERANHATSLHDDPEEPNWWCALLRDFDRLIAELAEARKVMTFVAGLIKEEHNRAAIANLRSFLSRHKEERT